MDWSGGTGSVGVRTAYERYLFPDNRTFLFCLHRLVHEGCVVPVRKGDRSSTLRVTNYSHQAWRRSTVGFFFSLSCVSGKKSCRTAATTFFKASCWKEKLNCCTWLNTKKKRTNTLCQHTNSLRWEMVHVSKPQFSPMSWKIILVPGRCAWWLEFLWILCFCACIRVSILVYHTGCFR